MNTLHVAHVASILAQDVQSIVACHQAILFEIPIPLCPDIWIVLSNQWSVRLISKWILILLWGLRDVQLLPSELLVIRDYLTSLLLEVRSLWDLLSDVPLSLLASGESVGLQSEGVGEQVNCLVILLIEDAEPLVLELLDFWKSEEPGPEWILLNEVPGSQSVHRDVLSSVLEMPCNEVVDVVSEQWGVVRGGHVAGRVVGL